MPSLFNRRSRSVSNSRPVTPASSSAHVAATQAFLANRQSQGNLSTSAAAAALRSMSPTPIPIDQIQTKRMLNRQASNASVGNATRGRSRPTLQRKLSSGSMTERTFRSPSPGRSSTPQANGSSNAPPVPPVPQTFLTEDVPPLPKKSHRRSMSLENFSTRVASPPPVKNQVTPRRNVSASNMAAAAATRSASLRQANELERSDSRNSYNFSYPRGSRPNSPPPQPRVGRPVAPNEIIPAKANGITALEARDIQNSLIQIAAKPVKKKKKKPVAENGEGSHLQSGSLNDHAISSTETQDPVSQEAAGVQPQQKRTKKKPKAAILSGENSHFPENNSTDQDTSAATTSDQVQESRAQRPTGTLVKQPSGVKEGWEGDQEDVRQSVEMPSSPTSAGTSVTKSARPAKKVQSKKTTTEANMSRKIEDTSRASVPANVTTPPPAQHKKGLLSNTTEASSGRQSSISPSRSFRFSDRIASDLTAGRKHDPLPRSISPAKSALKHHSPSRSDNSPTDGTFPDRRGSSVAPSESSEVSVDVAARKKANRVSFEATPEMVGAATGLDSAAQAQKDGGKRSWFGKSKKPSPLSKTSIEDDTGEGMKPRPVLPSFGSVRKNRQSDSSPSPASRKLDAASTSTGSLSEVSSTAEDSLHDNSASNDHAIGSVLSAHKERSGEHAFPPKAIPVEGTGYESDSESLSSDEDEDVVIKQSATGQFGIHGESTTKVPTVKSNDHDTSVVPAIAIQPATPGLDVSEQKEEWIDSDPSQLPASTVSGPTTASNELEHASGPLNPAVGLGFTSKDQEDELSSSESSVDEHRLNTIEEESDDNSLYDDAPEESSEIDGVGYGSINAIVDSPVVNSSPPTRNSELQDSPVVPDESEELSWKQSQAYWSGVSKKLKTEGKAPQQSDLNTEEIPGEDRQSQNSQHSRAALQPAAEIISKSKQKKKGNLNPVTTAVGSRSAPASDIQPASHEVPPIPNRNGARTSGSNAFRHSMREEPNAGPTLRMRPQSMIDTSAQPSTKAQRPMQKKQGVFAKPTPSKLSKGLSNDSDSDSSFKRARPRKLAGSGFSRRTMRAGPSPGERATTRTDRDVRSLSPVNRQPLSPGPSRMRTSMRGTQGSNGPTLRGQPQEKRSSSLFSKAHKAKSPSRPTSALGFKSRSQSRFADSDDDDDPAPSSYRSRYDDSSDEDEVEALRPVRGIPKRIDEGDSTDLEDSSDDQRRTGKPSTPKRNLEIKVPALASPVASEQLSPTTARKKGFWGRIRGKKDKEPNAQFTITERNKQSLALNGNTSIKDKDKETEEADAKNAAQLGFSSTAERDAMVEQMMRKLEAAQEQNSATQIPSQKRLTPQRVLSDTWPLPPKLNDIPEDRPVTSAGAGEPSRPGMGERQPTSETLRTAGGTAVYGRNGKKKKFPRLRRAFGLTD